MARDISYGISNLYYGGLVTVELPQAPYATDEIMCFVHASKMISYYRDLQYP